MNLYTVTEWSREDYKDGPQPWNSVFLSVEDAKETIIKELVGLFREDSSFETQLDMFTSDDVLRAEVVESFEETTNNDDGIWTEIAYDDTRWTITQVEVPENKT